MSRGERTAIWIVLGFIGLWLVVLTAVTAGELADIRRTLAGIAAGTHAVSESAAHAERATSESRGTAIVNPSAGKFSVGVVRATDITDTLALTVTVRAYGPGDLLYEPPVVTDGREEYPVTGESLEKARFAFLDLVTKGQAQARLDFPVVWSAGMHLTLVFNPRQDATSPLAPRLEVPVPVE